MIRQILTDVTLIEKASKFSSTFFVPYVSKIKQKRYQSINYNKVLNTIFTMKKVIISLCFLGLIGFSSCAKRYTCPTYLQNTEETQDKRVQHQPTATEKTETRN